MNTEAGSRVVGGGRGGFSLRPKTFSSFKNPVYRLYYGGMLGQMAAMNMQLVVGSLLIYRLTGSAAILGVMSLANAIPMICLSLFGGIIADRMQKKYVIIIGQTAFAVVSLSIALALTLGYLSVENPGSWWILVISSMLQGSTMALILPSRQAIIGEIVGGEQLMNAISLNVMGMNALQILAPALAGFLVDAFDFEAVYYTMTGMYLMAVVFIALLPLTGTTVKGGVSALTSIKEGLNYVRHDTIILIVLLFTLFAILLAMPYIILLPIFADDILKVGASGMGVLMSVSGVGAMIGSLVLASLPNKKRGLLLLASGVLSGSALAGFAFSSVWPLSLTLIVFVGLGQSGRMALSNTLLQYYVKNEYLGRVMSLFLMQLGLASFGSFAAGVLAEAIGVQWAIGGFAIILVFVSIMALSFVPRLRRLE
ncbi:MAG: MFS transporter [Dehalococcoidales bacterium]|nr:MFS transporter [Dehalococcoidales bacterium]